ncbi:hypothetical protein H671_1g3117 [Cricetulus griseus]|uniref:Uncharacterized protein n=1 Tax=Cricetulus griseus TaxID=10029 RepID=A0A061IP04_CRIGR|nr:hypothetical protein H671_1g3117 [Cricetulus griseus]
MCRWGSGRRCCPENNPRHILLRLELGVVGFMGVFGASRGLMGASGGLHVGFGEGSEDSIAKSEILSVLIHLLASPSSYVMFWLKENSHMNASIWCLVVATCSLRRSPPICSWLCGADISPPNPATTDVEKSCLPSAASTKCSGKFNPQCNSLGGYLLRGAVEVPPPCMHSCCHERCNMLSAILEEEAGPSQSCMQTPSS